MTEGMGWVRHAARAAGLAFVLLVVSCSGDRPTLPGTGGILLRLSFPDAGLPRPDSIKVEIRDSDGLRVGGATTALPTEGPLDTSVEVEVDAANDLRALALAEAPSGEGRGAVGFASFSGIDVSGGKTAEQALAVRSIIPEAPGVDGMPGHSSYVVHWGPVPGALSYVLRQVDGSVITDFSVADTARTMGPGMARGSARLRAARARVPVPQIPSSQRSYRVRSVLPLGVGLFGDSTSVDLDIWQDLPYVTAVAPGDGTTGIPDTSAIQVSFDRPMSTASLMDTLVSLRPQDGGAIVACTHGVTSDGKTVILEPLEPLDRGKWYRVRASTGLLDLEGRPLDQDPDAEGLQACISDFRSEEYDPLRVVSVEPAAGAADIPVGATVRVRLNRAIDPASLSSVSFSVSDTSGAISGLRRTAELGTVLEFVASRPFGYGLIHTVRVTSDLRDAARHEPLDQDLLTPGTQPFVSEFQSEPQPRGPRVIWSEPLPGEPLFPVFESPVLVFDRPIDPATVVFGDNLGLQLPLSGNVWVNVPGGVQVSVDSLRCTIVPSRALDRNSRYRIFANGGPGGILDRHGSPLDQDFQTAGFQSYGAEFRTEENTRVTSVDPANNQRDVAWDRPVKVRFQIPVRPESVADTSFVLFRGTTPLAAVLSLTPDSLEATLTPLDELAPDKTYRVRVGTGIRSRRGGALDQNWDAVGHQAFESTFTTSPDTTSPMVVAVDPADASRGVAIDRGVRVHFSKPMRPSTLPGYFHVTAVDSLGSEVSGTVTASPDSLSGVFQPTTPLASSTLYHVHVETWVRDRYGYRLDQDPDVFWYQKFHSVFTTESEKVRPQVVAIDPPDGAIDVSMTGPVTIDFSESMDRPSLAAGIRIETGGAAAAGTLSFSNNDTRVLWTPTTPLHAARSYHVTVDSLALDLVGNRLDQIPATPAYDPFVSSFRTIPDTTGPNIASVDPADGSTGVQIGIHPRLTFDEPIDPTSVTLGSITLVDSLGSALSTTLALGADDRSVEILPTGLLGFNEPYRITVYPTVADTAGNPFDSDPLAHGDQPFTSSFRTQNETVPPRVQALILDEGPPAPVDTRIRVLFTERIDSATVGDTSLVVSLGGVPIDGARSVSASGDTAIFRPFDDLEYETTYMVRVSGIRDLHGNRLDQDPATDGIQAYEGSFITGQDLEPPRVRRSVPAAGAVGVDVDALLQLTFSEPMDTSSFSPSDPGLTLDGVPVTATRTAEPGDTIFVFTPAAPLLGGRTYEWRAGVSLADVHGNTLDQNANQGGAQEFRASFEVGDRPIASAGAGVCSSSDSPSVTFDATDSHDPDGTIARAIWEWGDGSRDTLDAPAGLTASHTYECVDAHGCDGLDNDGDGAADEMGTEGCDESYHVRLTVVDDDGWSSTDSTGVSFCAFEVLASVPSNGTVDVDTLVAVSIDLTRACNPATADSNSVWIERTGGAKIPCTILFQSDGRQIVLTPETALEADTDYAIRAAGLLLSGNGDALDQDPCTDGVQEYTAAFHTRAAPGKLRRPPGAPR